MCYDYKFDSVLDVLTNLTIQVANNDTFAYVNFTLIFNNSVVICNLIYIIIHSIEYNGLNTY